MEPNKKEFRQLDPIKISMTGLDMFMKKYHRNKGITSLTERLRVLEALSENREVPESDKKDMSEILKTLGKIANCNLCHEEINWDKKEGLYTINPVETARHSSCHLKNHGTN